VITLGKESWKNEEMESNALKILGKRDLDFCFSLKSESERPRAGCAASAAESIRKGTGEHSRGCIVILFWPSVYVIN
jgi:hypothetical protein